MRIEQLEYVAAVTQYGSLRQASERLHISQPALSEAVSKLERELGVSLLDRRRSGARISRQGRELLQHLVDVLEAVERLRQAAGDQKASTRLVRLGTVNAASATLLAPALHALREHHPATAVEVVDSQQSEIQVGLEDGSLDLGLVNVLAGDDVPATLRSVELLRGRPVVVLPRDHPLCAQALISVDDLRREPFVVMRSGYAMHRFAHRLFGEDLPSIQHSTDGAEMGKLMVAEGLGFTLLPEYSVVGDPLERAGVIASRPIAGDATTVTLVVQHRPATHVPEQVRALRSALVEQAKFYRQQSRRAHPA